MYDHFVKAATCAPQSLDLVILGALLAFKGLFKLLIVRGDLLHHLDEWKLGDWSLKSLMVPPESVSVWFTLLSISFSPEERNCEQSSIM